jgi:hypothetical protein
MTNEINAVQALNCNMDSGSLSFNYSTDDSLNVNTSCENVISLTGINCSHITGWDYWQGYYYPQVIRESYPVYIQEKAKDSGKHAFEIIKVLMDNKLIKLDKVEDFVKAMDILIKQL